MSEDDSPELAAAIFHDAGFVVLPNAVDLELCNELLEVCRQDHGLQVWLGSWFVGRGELYLEGMWLYIKLIVTGGYVRNEIEVDLQNKLLVETDVEEHLDLEDLP